MLVKSDYYAVREVFEDSPFNHSYDYMFFCYEAAKEFIDEIEPESAPAPAYFELVKVPLEIEQEKFDWLFYSGWSDQDILEWLDEYRVETAYYERHPEEVLETKHRKQEAK